MNTPIYPTTTQVRPRRRLKVVSTMICAALFAPLGGGIQTASAAVQMGGYMDFVLKSGRTIRVYPEAVDTGPIRPGNILPKKQKVETKPTTGDPCLRLEADYNKRIAAKQQAKAQSNQMIKPAWAKKTPKVKQIAFRPYWTRIGKPKGWYYLPAEPRVAMKSATLPEATFVKFITDEAEGKNSAEGGIFHVMVTYGLTPEEEKELEAALKDAVSGAVLKGMVDLEPSKQTDNFIVTSGTLSDEGFAPSGVLTSGRAPSFPGAKAAVAGRLSSLGAQLMETTFENPTSDLSVTFAYDYIVKTPAYTGEVRIDLDKINEAAECSLRTKDSQKKTNWKVKGWLTPIGIFGSIKKETKTVRVSKKQLEEAYDTLVTLGAVQIKIDQNLPDADVSAIESSLMTMAMESFSNMQKTFMTNDELRAAQEAQKEKKEVRDPNVEKYEVFTMKRKQSRQTGVITLKIEKGVALYKTHSMTGNIGGLLRQHKDQVFDEVLLNDPFFKRGKITVDLDTEALELFESEMVNNAAVKIVIPFQDTPFTDDKVFTRTDVSEGGILKEFSFATQGQNVMDRSCVFKYIESWSLKGGGKWPTNPREKCSSEMAVTLVPPITLRRIDVEADLDEMERAGVRGADVVLRHTRYGEERTETARFRVVKGEPYIEHTLYVDKNDPSVEYKVVLTHRDKGKFSTRWQKLEDDFVFASLSGLPRDTLDELREKVPQIKELLEEVTALVDLDSDE